MHRVLFNERLTFDRFELYIQSQSAAIKRTMHFKDSFILERDEAKYAYIRFRIIPGR